MRLSHDLQYYVRKFYVDNGWNIPFRKIDLSDRLKEI